MKTLGEELLRALKAAGAEAVFGLPGDYALPFFEVIERSGILPLYTLSHEPAIGFAADGAVRYGGGVGVAAVTYGAGAMNLVNTVACAWAEHSPLVVISGAPGAGEMEHGLMLHHQIRTHETQMQVFREFTCDQVRLDNPVEAPLQIARVIRNCIKHSRPVYIEFPRDMVAVECEPVGVDFSAEPVVPYSLLSQCLADLEQRLGEAKRPVLLTGSQVRRFGLENNVWTWAQRHSVPLLTSFMGKGLFAGKGEPYIGSYLGLAGDETLRSLVEESDFAMILGVIPCDTNWGVSGQRLNEKNTLLATANQVVIAGKCYPGLTLRALAGLLLRVSCAPCWESLPSRPPRRPYVPSSGALLADDIAPALEHVIDAGGVRMPVVADVGDCLFSAMDLPDWPLLASGYYATMGFAVPAALGLQAATGERPLVLIGDGGFQMTGWELINCQRYGLTPVVVVFNNSRWEMLRQFQPQSHYTELSRASYAAIAETLGGRGMRVESATELASALEKALADTRHFWLIEAMLQPGDCTTTMKRYTTAIKANMQKKR